jgi:leucyl/phenylalanyl-tRNA--protein transferase
MPVYRIPEELVFPPATEAEPDGLLGVGGDLRPERLLLGYASGIFPWYHDGLPILWHSPDPRMVLDPHDLHVPRSLGRSLRRGRYEIRLDTDFEGVIDGCAAGDRPGQDGTWITAEMRDAYCRLHTLGYAHSAEAWSDGALVGGLYGVALGGVFFGESMFALAADASKCAFVVLVRQLLRWGTALIDCQVHTGHLQRFGAREWPRSRYLARLEELIELPTNRGLWRLDDDLRVPRPTTQAARGLGDERGDGAARAAVGERVRS